MPLAEEALAHCAQLGITPAHLAARRLPPQPVAGREGVTLQLISGFRSLPFQAALIEAKLARGQSLEEVLRINAPPGFSEHHTGRALDIGSPGCAPLDEAFEHTAAFSWLLRNAARFGFALSYPRDNPAGFLYEPWHWCHRAVTRKPLNRR